MAEINVKVSAEAFRFNKFSDWVNGAGSLFEIAELKDRDVLCVDAKGRVCLTGTEFIRARDDNSFPIIVYRALCEELRNEANERRT